MSRIGRALAPLALIAMTATPVLAEGDIANLTDAERSALRAEVRAYLLENPEVIYEAIQILEERRNQAAAVEDGELVKQNADALLADGYSYVGGNPDGDVTMVEFLDYRCGYCKRAHPHVKEVLAKDPNLRYVIKEFPILGPESVAAGRMALAALSLDPSKYAELNDRLMSFDGQLGEQAAYRIAREVGYDIGALKSAAASDDIGSRIEETYALAQSLGIQGTPSFVIGNEVVRGFIPAEDILATIESQREAASN